MTITLTVLAVLAVTAYLAAITLMLMGDRPADVDDECVEVEIEPADVDDECVEVEIEPAYDPLDSRIPLAEVERRLSALLPPSAYLGYDRTPLAEAYITLELPTGETPALTAAGR